MTERTIDPGDTPRVVALSADLIDRSKISAAFPAAILVRSVVKLSDAVTTNAVTTNAGPQVLGPPDYWSSSTSVGLRTSRSCTNSVGTSLVLVAMWTKSNSLQPKPSGSKLCLALCSFDGSRTVISSRCFQNAFSLFPQCEQGLAGADAVTTNL